MKGTGIVAKPGALDELIEFFNEDEDKKEAAPSDGTKTISEKTPMKEDEVQKLKEYDEDSEVTLRDRVIPKNLKHD